MTDEVSTFSLECRVAEDMVGVDVGVDHVADRLGRAGADRRQQPAPFTHAAAAIDHRDPLVADDKSEIGNRTFVVTRHEREGAGVNKDPARHLGYSEGFRKLLRAGDEIHRAGGEHQYRSKGHSRPGHALVFLVATRRRQA